MARHFRERWATFGSLIPRGLESGQTASACTGTVPTGPASRRCAPVLLHHVQVNAALDEAALHAEQLARWMAAVRAHAVQRVPAEERKRASELFHAIAVSLHCSVAAVDGQQSLACDCPCWLADPR